MRKKAIYAGLIAAGLAMLPAWGQAAGLGKLNVSSALGQPLRAEAEIFAEKQESPDDFAVKLASADAYRAANMEWVPVLSSLRFSIEKKAGKPVLRITSNQSINEPFLPVLVEMKWPNGQIVRDFTILLDPPGYGAVAASSSVSLPQSTTAASTGAGSAAASSAKPARPAKKNRPEPVADTTGPGADAGADSVKVQSGDTLTSIASRLKPEGVRLEQMLLGLFQENQQAFSGNNMNRLRAGQILRVPEKEKLQQLEVSAARKEIKMQADDWHAYRQKLAGTVEQGQAVADKQPRQAVSGKIAQAAEDKAAPKTQPAQDVLKLSKGEPAGKAGAAAGKDSKAMQDKLQAMSEEATAREKAIKEANSRIGDLEKNVQEMQKLLALKNQQLADMQKQAATKAAAPAAVAAKPAAPVAAEVKPVDVKPVVAPVVAASAVAASAVAASAPVAVAASDMAASAVAASEVKPASAVAAAKPKKKKAVPPPEPMPEPQWYEAVLDDPTMLAAGGGALALLLGGWAYVAMRRRRKKLTSFEDSIMAGGDLKANTVLGETSGGTVDTGNDTSFLTDFSQTGFNAIDTNDVDPIAEAEVYMAYGRDAQAEEILKEAMVKTPERHEIHLKLLEIYAARKNLVAFETLASELYAALGGKPTGVWEKAATLGRQLDPNNPLYASKGGAGEETGAAAAVAGVAAVAATQAVMADEPVSSLNLPEPAELQAEESAAENVLEFDAPAGVAEAAEESANVMEFDLGLPAVTQPDAGADESMLSDLDAATVVASVAEPELPAIETAMPEFDLGLPEQAEEMDALALPEVAATDEVSLDIPSFAAAEDVSLAAEPAEVNFEPSLDLDVPSFDLPDVAEEAPAPVAEAGVAEFDLGLPEMAAVEEIAAPVVEEMMPAAEPDLNFDFDAGLTGAAEPAVAEEAPPDMDMGDLNLDFNVPEVEQTAGLPEELMTDTAQNPGTKLDLAKAYLEIGDEEGAREILQEVQAEGNDAQKAEAAQMLTQLG